MTRNFSGESSLSGNLGTGTNRFRAKAAASRSAETLICLPANQKRSFVNEPIEAQKNEQTTRNIFDYSFDWVVIEREEAK